MRRGRLSQPPAQSSFACLYLRRFATSPPSPPSASSSPPSPPHRSPAASLPPTPAPNPHLSASELSAEQLDAILRTEQQRRQTVHSKQQQLDQLLQQLQHETAHDEAQAALSRYERLVRALTYNQRGIKLLAVLLAVASLASSMQLLVAKDRTQQTTAAARQLLDERRDALNREEAAVEEVARRLREYLALRVDQAAAADEKAWLEALQRRVSEVEAASVCSADETKVRQAVHTLERDINVRHEANKRKPWW